MIKPYFHFILLFSATILAQEPTTSNEKIYRVFDQLVGLDNNGLFNGPEFIDLYLNTDGTFRYLEGFDYTQGSVIYRGQYYVDVWLKYDLLEDQLLTKSKDNLGIFNVKLIHEFVSEFTLKDRHFVKLKDFGQKNFFELGYQGQELDLYINHKKNKKKRVLKSGVQYSFKPLNYYLFKYQETYARVETISNVRREFPEYKKEINDFYHNSKTLYIQDRDSFMKKLAPYLDNLLQKTKS
ncbi:hypothetical protein EI546_04365 [Aequorivita sp. H23M31]|uniref:Uncharacterized protein n=1 Tax=Aequorivita ciconiae TaxID=2494375 RepID=A0A410G187_9FLAO|nr:hypothetical protein [Aequorivita sp. H23M31]QAA81009.1 hypothetical protein EI546_04365 [Aequorivita sp. H23M31]